MTTNFKGNPVTLIGSLPKEGDKAPNFVGVKNDLSDLDLSSLKGKRVVLNIFPSIDTGVCAASVRKFNKIASELENTVVLCVSKDLPFAQARFCGAEGLENVIPVSIFKDLSFQKDYGVLMQDGPLAGLLARSVVILDEKGEVIYTELVPEITTEPDYDKAVSKLK